MKKKIQCPFCFERFAVELFPEDGTQQEIVYDCEICCHPIDLHASWDEDLGKFHVDIRRSSGFD